MNTILFGLGFPMSLALGAAATPLVAASAQGELDPETLERVVESLAQAVEENYVFEDVATELGAKLRQSLWDGRYEGMSLDRVTALMTTDLRSVNNDLHLGVRPVPEQARGLVESDPEEVQRRHLEQARHGPEAAGLLGPEPRAVERLDGLGRGLVEPPSLVVGVIVG